MSPPEASPASLTESTVVAVPPASESGAGAAPDGAIEQAKQRIATIERELRFGLPQATAALLFHEMGRLWEEPLKNPRNAALAYQNAYKLAPDFLSNLQAARRIFFEAGNWQMVVQLLDAEGAATPSTEADHRRQTLLIEKGLLLEQKLARLDEARAQYLQCLAQNPSDLAVLAALEEAFSRLDDAEALAQVYRLLAGVLRDAKLRAHYLTSAGLLLEQRLAKLPESASAFRAAFALDRSSPVLLAAMIRLTEREADPSGEELLGVLNAEAERLGSASVPVYLRIAKVHQRFGRHGPALEALLSARKRDPRNPLLLSELAAVYQAQGRHQDLAQVLADWIEALSSPPKPSQPPHGDEIVALQLRLAALFEESLKRDNDAILQYRAVLNRAPGHAGALAGLGKLFYRTKNWAALLAVFEAEAASATEPKLKAARLYKAAEVLEERLGRREEAITGYNQCLQLEPGYLPAQKALARLYQKLERYSDLVGLLETELSQLDEQSPKGQRLMLMARIAQLHEERLRDSPAAIEYWKEMLELEPGYLPALRNLSRLYEISGQWAELIAVQEAEAQRLGDVRQLLSTYHRSAELLEEQVRDIPGAIAAYEKVLSISPAYLPALRALGRLYAHEKRWEDLIRMYLTEADSASAPEAAANLTFRVGELYEKHLHNEAAAIAAYHEALALDPRLFAALRALGRIYRGQRAWSQLVNVLQAEAASRNEPSERAQALFQAAGIWEDALNAPVQATAAYEEVLHLAPGHVPSIRALERLYGAKGDVKGQIAVLDHEAQTAAAAGDRQALLSARLKLASLYLDRLGEADRAAQCCEQALTLDPKNLFALKLQSRIRSRGSDRAIQAKLRAELSTELSEAPLRGALQLVPTWEGSLPEAGSRALDALQAAFDSHPADPRLAFALERALLAQKDWAALGSFYQRRLEATEVHHAEARVELLLRIAEIAENRTGDPQKALACYKRAGALAPSFVPAASGIRRIALSLGDLPTARLAYEAEGAGLRDPRSSVQAFVAAAKLCRDSLADIPGAIANFRRALERDPLDPEAQAGLEGLLKGQDVEGLARLYVGRGDALLVRREAAAAAEAFLLGAGKWVKLGRPGAALEAVEKALLATPHGSEALELKAKLCREAGKHAEAAAALEQRVAQPGARPELAGMHRELAALYADQLGEPDRALGHLKEALLGAPEDRIAIERMAQLRGLRREWTEAIEQYQRLLELEQEPKARARHLSALAQLHDHGLAAPEAAVGLYRQALEAAPGDSLAIDRLAELLERQGALPALSELLEAEASRARTRDVEQAVALTLRAASVRGDALGDPLGALALLQQAVQLAPKHLEARRRLADFYAAPSAPAAEPLEVIEAHRATLSLDPARVESLHAIFKICVAQAGDSFRDRAFLASSLLRLLGGADDLERAFHERYSGQLGAAPAKPLGAVDLEALTPPAARNPAAEVFRAMGDRLGRLHPTERKGERLPSDHPVVREVESLLEVLGPATGLAQLECYGRRDESGPWVTTASGEPHAIVVSLDRIGQLSPSELRFMLASALFGAFNQTAVADRLGLKQLAALLGNAVRIYEPLFSGPGPLGQKDEEATKALRKAFSRRGLKALEAPARAMLKVTVDLPGTVQGLRASNQRAGLLMSGEPLNGVRALLRQLKPNLELESPERVAEAVRALPEVAELMQFSLSDDFLRTRHRLGVGLP